MAPQQHYQAYRAAIQTVAPSRQIVLLYDGAVRYMQQARDAVARKDITQRYNLLVKVGEIITGLQNSLDYNTGEHIAHVLYDFYARVGMEIMGIHQSNSLEACDLVVSQLKQMRDVWDRIDQAQSQRNAVQNNAAVSASLSAEVLNAAFSA